MLVRMREGYLIIPSWQLRESGEEKVLPCLSGGLVVKPIFAKGVWGRTRLPYNVVARCADLDELRRAHQGADFFRIVVEDEVLGGRSVMFQAIDLMGVLRKVFVKSYAYLIPVALGGVFGGIAYSVRYYFAGLGAG